MSEGVACAACCNGRSARPAGVGASWRRVAACCEGASGLKAAAAAKKRQWEAEREELDFHEGQPLRVPDVKRRSWAVMKVCI